jgi:WD40 repeat protein
MRIINIRVLHSTIRIWNHAQCTQTLVGPPNSAVWDLLALENGDIIAAVSDRSIKLWRGDNVAKTYVVYLVVRCTALHCTALHCAAF